jgi:hypothetical protein
MGGAILSGLIFFTESHKLANLEPRLTHGHEQRSSWKKARQPGAGLSRFSSSAVVGCGDLCQWPDQGLEILSQKVTIDPAHRDGSIMRSVLHLINNITTATTSTLKGTATIQRIESLQLTDRFDGGDSARALSVPQT